jgi:signal transduction histidine kinase
MGPEVSRYELLEREILEIADHEKQSLGRELHDGLCQSLAGIAALAATLSRSLTANSEPGPAAASASRGMTRECISPSRITRGRLFTGAPE